MSCLLRMQKFNFQLLLKNYHFDTKCQKSLFIEYNRCYAIKSVNKFVCFCTKMKRKICYIFTVLFADFFIKSIAIPIFICYNIERIEGQFKKIHIRLNGGD